MECHKGFFRGSIDMENLTLFFWGGKVSYISTSWLEFLNQPYPQLLHLFCDSLTTPLMMGTLSPIIMEVENGKWLYLKGTYWRDPFLTSMIMGGNVFLGGDVGKTGSER